MAMLEKLFSRNRPQKLGPENGQQRVIPEADYQRFVFYGLYISQQVRRGPESGYAQ